MTHCLNYEAERDFTAFLRGLRADASEGRQTHGGHALLRRLSDAEDGATYTQPPATARRATDPAQCGIATAGGTA